MTKRYAETLHNCSTLTELFLLKNQQHVKGISFVGSDGDERFLSYSDLLSNAKKILGYLQASGVKKGDTVIFLLTNNYDFIHLYWSCVLGGIVPVPIPADPIEENKNRFIKIIDTMQSAYVAFDSHSETIAKEVVEKNILGQRNTLKAEDFYTYAFDGEIYDASPEDAVLIQYSSGSTGDPKGVVLSHANIMASLDMMIHRSQATSDDVMIAWMPLTHDMGLIGCHLKYCAVNATVYYMQTATFLRNPLLLLQKATEHRGTVLILANFSLKMLINSIQGKENLNLDLSSLRLIFNGGEAVSAEGCLKFIETFKSFGLKQTTVYPVYGMAEATLGIAFPRLEEPIFNSVIIDRRYANVGDKVIYLDAKTDNNAIEYVDCGYPLRNCKIRICDDDGNDLGENRFGIIEVSGDCVFDRYYNNEPNNKSNGWYCTSDYGFFHEGRLIITGRIKESMVIKGQNYCATDLERIAEQAEGVLPGHAVVCPIRLAGSEADELGVFICTSNTLEAFAPVVLSIRQQFSASAMLIVNYIIPIDSIPKTASGKIKRVFLSNSFTEGKYDRTLAELNLHVADCLANRTTVCSGEQDKVEAKLIEMWNSICPNTDITPEENLFSYGIDSIRILEFLSSINKISREPLEITDIYYYQNVRGIAKLISQGR